MNVLFVGLGSIGRRNLEACLRVRPGFSYAALRSGKGASPDLGDLAAKVRTLGSWDEAKGFGPRSVWVCNPTALHRDAVSQAASLGASVFVEKPLAHSADDVRAIADAVEHSGQAFFYGCILREHPLIERVKRLLDSGELGRAISYQTYCGSYLPDWRPGRDYRQVYSAQKAMGGGVALDLIHDFDYPDYWFDASERLEGRKAKLSDLEIDCEDFCSASVLHRSGVLGQTTVTYFRREPKRSFEVLCSGGVLEGDLLTGRLRIVARTGARDEEHRATRDELHDHQARRVFEALESGAGSPWRVRDVASLTEKLIALGY
jgi:predicted dehydrogenase